MWSTCRVTRRCWFSRLGLPYKSVATQIPHDVGLAPVRPAGLQT